MLIRNLLLFGFIFTIIVSGCSTDKKEVEETTGLKTYETEISSPNDGKKAPDFTLLTPDGKEVKLSDYAGKVILLDFWATWCPPCVKSVPDLIAIHKEFEGEAVVIGVSLDKETNTANEVAPFLEKFAVNYPVVMGDKAIANAYGGVEAIPTMFVIDQKGNIVNKHIGFSEKSKYVAEIKKLLGKS